MMIVPGSAFIPKAASGGAPSWANVILLLHLDADFTDEKSNTTTTYGDVYTTGQGAYADGAGGDRFSVNEWLDFLSDDFTFELFYKPEQTFGIIWIMPNTATLEYSGVGKLSFTRLKVGGGSSVFGSANGTFDGSISNWYHIAVTRSGDTYRLFLDGVKVHESDDSSVFRTGTPDEKSWFFALYDGSSDTPGFIDEVRITKGVARYTVDFTVPSAPFPNS
jgi:hypothetical protein